jgi:predicted nucleotidyltransferase component of viral defense system
MDSPVRTVEQFHLLFLAQLGRRVDKGLFVLKGGCNLRFFHGSIRYSEDMDLDLGNIDTQVFRDKVREVFASRPTTGRTTTHPRSGTPWSWR